MKKLKKFIPLLLSLSSLLFSCNSNENNDTKDDNKNDDTTWVKEEFDEPDVEEVFSGSSGGFLIDINVETKLIVGYTYSCKYTPNGNSTYYTVKSSDTSMFEVSKDSDESTSFTINCLKAGNGYITIYDKDEMILYRKIIRIRTPMPANYVLTYLFETPYFRGYPGLGTHKLVFTDKEGTGNLSGSDELESNINLDFKVSLTSNYESYFDEYEQLGNIYVLEFSEYDSNQTSSIVPQIMYLSLAGDYIRFYYGSTLESAYLLNIFYPSDELSLHGLEEE